MAAVRLATYGTDEDLYAVLLRLIDEAKQRVWIKVAWWDGSAAAQKLTKAVVRAKTRGLDVLVICRPEASNDAALRELRDAGVRVVGVRYIHEKELLVDEQAVNHSMNFTSKEIERNQNSGLLNEDPLIVEAIQLGFQSMLDNLDATQVGDEEWSSASTLIPEEWLKFIERPRLNPLQSKAVPAVLSAPGHVIVVAPTSSGKTLIGEVAALRSILGEKKPAVWLVPARALAAEFAETAQRWSKFGIRSVMLTGETNMSSEAIRSAHLWIATTEKFESLYRRSSLRDHIANVGCLIIDEVHLVGDRERGAMLESLIARLRQASERTRIVALSATVANAQELADWFDATLISSTWRPTVLITQLVPYDVSPDAKWKEREEAKDSVLLPLLREVLRASAPSAFDEIEEGEAEPSALVFCAAKNAAHGAASLYADIVWDKNQDKSQNIELCYAKGVGIHYKDAHEMKRALNDFRARKLRLLAATSGLSTGVNTPARSVIIRDLVLGKDTPLEVSQAQQMLGRAGRAGQGSAVGFGFVLVPRYEEDAWKVKLAEGYTAQSRVLASLADCLLAEILLGSVMDGESARTWFKGTLAFSQDGDEGSIDDALDFLVMRGFVVESDGELTPTEIGALTSRLMIDVASAAALLSAIPEIPVPGSSAEAEEAVLCALTTNVVSLRDWPVNEDTYGQVTAELLFNWSPRVTKRMGHDFGARFCMAGAQMALREPAKLRSRHPTISVPEYRHTVDAMPRYLTWMAALGHTDATTWAPAVAGDLARRLTWWSLEPHPRLGEGRLLWLLEKTLDPQNRTTRLPGLWTRARRAGFEGPDSIRARPKDVDCTVEEFASILQERADLAVAPPQGRNVSISTAAVSARLTALTTRGNRSTVSTTRPVHGKFELPPVPGPTTERELAGDFFLYTKGGDFSYDNLIANLLPGDVVVVDPVREARRVVKQLPERVVVEHRRGVLKGRFMSERRKRSALVLPLIAPDPAMTLIAAELAEHEADPRLAVCQLRRNLTTMLDGADSAGLRPATTVLKSGVASPTEFQLVLVTLMASLHLETGVAADGEDLLAMVRLNDEWQLATSTLSRNVRIAPVIPDGLPAVVDSLSDPDPVEPTVAKPQFGWMADFARR